MNKWITSVIFLFVWLNPFTYVSDSNQYQEEAFDAYKNGENSLSISLYQKLIQEYGIKNEMIQLNLAHAYFRVEVLDSAYKYYALLTESEDANLQSIAYMQMGLLMLTDNTKQPEEALLFFKEAIYASSTNAKARYNYELLLKKQSENRINPDKENSEEEQEKEENNNSNTDGGNSEDNQTEGTTEGSGDSNGGNAESEDGDKDDSPSPQVRLDKLEDMNLNPEKAEMILDAMKNQEIQYHQQRTREPKKSRKSGRPNW